MPKSVEINKTSTINLNIIFSRFWTHMFGSGIGELNVYVQNGGKEDSKIWGLSGDAGNNWYMGQAPIASSSPFKVTHP